MPYIEGETLRDKLTREHQLGVDEAVRITTEIADALDYAHRNGVIHRDIKPENILLHDGRPMVADFGIALAVSAAAGGRMTETGLSLGTPHYMSPEQATAEKELTARSDVYSLASVLYEMLTGEPPHSGGSAQAIIMKIVTDTARPVTELRKSVPPNVAAAVARALEKVAADRFETAATFAEALRDPHFSVALPVTMAAEARRPTAARGWQPYTWTAAVVLLAALAAWGWFRPGPVPLVGRYGLALPAGQELAEHGSHPVFALAPDGSWIVYDGPAESGGQLWVKQRDAYEAAPLPGTAHQGGSAPAVSPDGEWIVFTTGGQLRKVPKGGGSAITVADSVSGVTRGVAWLDDGTIVYRDILNRLRRVSDVGGVSEVVWSPPGDRDIRPRLPTPLPDARGVLFSQCLGGSCRDQALWVLDLESGEDREVAADAPQGWFASTGHVVYVRRDGGVFALPFDLGSLAPTGPAVPVLEGVNVENGGLLPRFALSLSGALLMKAGSAGGTGAAGAPSEALWVERDGTVAPVDPDWNFSTFGSRSWSLSPDGSKLAIAIVASGGVDIWVKQLDRGPVQRLTVHPAVEQRPRWTPDGASVRFLSDRDSVQSVYERRADGTGTAERVLEMENVIWEAHESEDGAWLAVRTGSGGADTVWAIRADADSAPVPILASEFDERAVSLSPDGRWIAYHSNETGQDEVYVRPFPDVSGGKWPISLGGGRIPLWAHGGGELFYVDGNDRMVAAQLDFSTSLAVTERRVLFSVEDYYVNANYTLWDISPDDQRFLMLGPLGASDGIGGGALILVENWFEELRTKVGR
jgi:serine/threonine-protein kinase